MKPAPSSRLVFIDWLRRFSILFMIVTHAFNSLLKPFLKEEGWFQLLNFFNGLVAAFVSVCFRVGFRRRQ
jgi:uncharacterized membrane protein